MFYQNSNDLVKRASAESQNSSQTKNNLIKSLDSQFGAELGDKAHILPSEHSQEPLSNQRSDNILFNEIKSRINMSPDIDKLGSAGNIDGFTTGENNGIDTENIRIQNDKYMIQERENTRKVKTISDIVTSDDKRTRNNWVQVVDRNGLSKYGYITKDNIFQVWYVPGNPSNNPVNWFTNEPIKQNNAVLGCPRFAASINSIEITKSWDEIKPFEGVFTKYDDKNPAFFLTDTGVRDVNRSYKKSGLFSCGAELMNVAVKERPAADFDFEQNNNNPYKQGCFVLKPGKSVGVDLAKGGFTIQEDLGKTSISKCKRRAEDLGRTYFFMAENSESAKNKADCYVYTASGVPNIETIVSLDDKGTTCHNVNSNEAEEDGFMKAYDHTLLPRMYGTNKTTTIKTPAKCPPGYKNPTADVNNKNYCYAGWSPSCGESCAKKSCVDNGGKWIPLDYRYNAYTCQMAESKIDKPTSQSISLYTLKSSGPNAVDTLEPEKTGLVGKIAFITHNGERREYSKDLLKTDTGLSMNINDVAFMEVGNYDTKTKGDNYGVGGAGDNGIDNITFEECKKRCVENKNSGGFVFTGSKTSGTGKCQLKHKDKMFPIGLRQSDPTKTLVLKMPAIQDSVSNDCKNIGRSEKDGGSSSSNNYIGIDSMQYAYYLDGGFMTKDTKCDITKHIPQDNTIKPVDATKLAREFNNEIQQTQQKISGALNPQIQSSGIRQGFTLREGIDGPGDFTGSSYDVKTRGVAENIKKIGNATRQQETINAFKNESNIRLIAESYKFILWTILAILAVMAVMKLKEKITDEGQDDNTLLSFFTSLGAGVKMDDISDKTETVKNTLSETADQARNGVSSAINEITDGADKVVSTAEDGISNISNEISNGISNMGNKMSEVTDNIKNMNYSSFSGPSGPSGPAGPAGPAAPVSGPARPSGVPTTGGRGMSRRK